jgi:hypothetical protein
LVSLGLFGLFWAVSDNFVYDLCTTRDCGVSRPHEPELFGIANASAVDTCLLRRTLDSRSLPTFVL